MAGKNLYACPQFSAEIFHSEVISPMYFKVSDVSTTSLGTALLGTGLSSGFSSLVGPDRNGIRTLSFDVEARRALFRRCIRGSLTESPYMPLEMLDLRCQCGLLTSSHLTSSRT